MSDQHCRRCWGRRGSQFPARAAAEALHWLSRGRFHLVVTDLKMPGMDGIELLKQIRSADSQIEVIVMTAYGTIETAVTAMREGAYDYITKPLDFERLSVLIQKALQRQSLLSENTRLRRVVRVKDKFGQLIGGSGAMAEIFRLVEGVAPTDATVLIQGESGVGKELIANSLHQRSRRSKSPMISLNCGSLPESLLENELFGHERGAFTGADAVRPGKIELANGGTLFLDEVGEMSPRTQVEFLRVLDQRQLRRLGVSIRLVRRRAAAFWLGSEVFVKAFPRPRGESPGVCELRRLRLSGAQSRA